MSEREHEMHWNIRLIYPIWDRIFRNLTEPTKQTDGTVKNQTKPLVMDGAFRNKAEPSEIKRYCEKLGETIFAWTLVENRTIQNTAKTKSIIQLKRKECISGSVSGWCWSPLSVTRSKMEAFVKSLWIKARSQVTDPIAEVTERERDLASRWCKP